jgi:putative protein-disulfide isomerase
MMANENPVKPTVVYGNDPLCGWCFAIGPALLRAKSVLANEVDWRLMCGGLVLGERVRPIAFDAQYLKQGFAQVLAVSGRKTGQPYWDKVVSVGSWISNSEPLCRAIFAARDLDSDRVFEFSHGLSEALYIHGEHPDSEQTILQVANDTGYNANELIRNWKATDAFEATQRSFKQARAFGVTSYPSLLLVHNNKVVPVLAGFADEATIVATIRAAIR